MSSVQEIRIVNLMRFMLTLTIARECSHEHSYSKIFQLI